MRIFVIDKPLHATSHDVVARARKLLGTRRVGHAGTLDPLATGVLTLLVDEGTKLSPFLTDSRKRYLAWISFGATTPTLDAEGPLIEGPIGAGEPTDTELVERDRAEKPGSRASGNRIEPGEPVTEERIEAALPAFLELTEQVPPQYSAVKQSGVKGYQAARTGGSLPLPPRPAGYRQVELLAFASHRDLLPNRVAPVSGRWLPQQGGRAVPLPDPLGAFPSALVSLEVRAGTYVRSFARDLGTALGTTAFLSGLLRTASGGLDLSMATLPEDLPHAAPLEPARVLPYPQITLEPGEAARVRKGQRLPLPLTERTTLLDRDGNLVAVAEQIEGRMKLLRVWRGE